MKTQLKQFFNLLIKYLRPQWHKVIILGVLLMASIGLQILNPQIVRFFLDAATTGGATKTLIITALLFIGVSLIQQILAVSSTYMCQNVGWSSTNALREDLILHCINLDMEFHKSKQPGEIIERLDSDVNMLFDFFSKLILDILGNIILIAGILVVLLREDWRISLALTVFALISITILSIYQSYGVKPWGEEREASAKFFGFLGEQLSNTEDIKSSGAVGYSMHRFHQYIQQLFPATFKATMMHYKLWNISTVLGASGVALALGVGGYLWKTDIISLGTVYLILNYTQLINNPLEKIRRQLSVLQKARASISRVEELLEIKSAIIDGKEELAANISLPLQVKNLSFEYADDVAVLKEVSFNLKPKRVLGILGRTGSGKTTLARLLVRLYDPTKGSIHIDNKDLRQLKMDDLRNHIAYVTQDVQLFNATVRDNLTFFNTDIDDETIMNTLYHIGLGEWIKSFDNGLDTVLESGGGSMSSGEGQILALIRVFLKNPGLVILDEASSRLDPITEKFMERAIDRLLVDRSSIIIAHRLSTLERADDILILDNGRVVEYGPRKDLLMDKDSKYYQLLQRGIEEVLV